jgi:dolichyl-phosphate beta-glucosyltransferase
VGVVLRTIIIVPCYNEAARLDSAAFAAFLSSEMNVRFLFVDDGSRDATGDVVRALARECPRRVQLLQLRQNHGKAEAVRAGILEAARLQPDLIGYWDADLATPLTEIPAMATRFADSRIGLVVGARIRMLGRDIRRSGLRHYGGRVFATFASLQLHLPVYDTQCGAKIFRVTPEIVTIFDRPFRLRWCFDVELLARFHASITATGCGLCVEHPLSRWADVGASKLTIAQALSVLPELIKLPAVIRDERRRS